MATTSTAIAGAYEGVALSFQEAMWGSIHAAESSAQDSFLGGFEAARTGFDVQIRIDDLGRFLRDPNHAATLSGTVTFPPVGANIPIRDGRFELFSLDAATGMRRMVYFLRFTPPDGRTYCLSGHKEISDNPAELDLLQDMTRLYTRIHCGEDETAPLCGEGELYFHLGDAAALLSSIRVEGACSWTQQVGARFALASLLWGALREEYFKPLRLFYDSGYENLVVAGQLSGPAEGVEEPFFLVSGVHDKGFPWGDGEMFWDVLLAIGDSGHRRLYAITDRVLPGLELDLTRGVYAYSGPLFRVQEGYATAFSTMRNKESSLEEIAARIEIQFDAAAFETVGYPFPVVNSAVRRLSSDLQAKLREALPGERGLGIQITPHQASVRSGQIVLRGGAGSETTWSIRADRTWGECESGSFRNLKEPTLLYGYLCAVDPEERKARVQIAARTLRNERTDWGKDQLDRYLGAIVARTSSSEMLLEKGGLKVTPMGPGGVAPLRKLGAPVLEVNNDHYPTAVFQRRIVEVEDSQQRRYLALEEDMSTMRREPIRSTRTVTIASFSGEGKEAVLERVLDASGFDAAIGESLRTSGKNRQRFLVAIKPNFMFAYDKRDRTTYTDPQLVAALVRRLRGQGFENIKVVEAQSTYGEYFDHRGVRDMAGYLGFDSSAGYEVVDLTEDIAEYRDLGPALGQHPVPRTWRDADFRISFAKNKTHSYAYYSLTLKNIYGALPFANKFKEYHCARDIYRTTIDYLRQFPVQFGIIDGWVSADGPFGVFADPGPNETRTIIGGADLVAVDWVGATRMGIDPMISTYMQLAVEAFGKPAIQLVGESSPYRPWLNVPSVLPPLAHGAMDAEYEFGNLLYSVAAQMDETHFHHKSNAPHIRLLRVLTTPLRRTFFVRTGEHRTKLNRWVSRLFYHLGC